MIANVHGKEGDAFAELLVGRTYHRVLAYNTVTPTAHIRQIPTYYGAALYNHLAIEHYVLRATEHCLAAHFVAGGL